MTSYGNIDRLETLRQEAKIYAQLEVKRHQDRATLTQALKVILAVYQSWTIGEPPLHIQVQRKTT
jgi:hypothetical protein